MNDDAVPPRQVATCCGGSAQDQSVLSFESLVEACPQALLVAQQGSIAYSNPAFALLLGLPPSERLLGARLGDFLAQSPEQAHFAGSRADPLLVQDQARLTRPDGTMVECEADVAPLCWEGKGAVQVLLRDVSARRFRERLREQRLAELEQSNTALDDFDQLVSHDLKEPLRGIWTAAEALLAGHSQHLDAEGRDLAATLANLPRRLSAMIDALLDYARLGAMIASRDSVDMQDVIAEVVGRLTPWLLQQGARVDVETPVPVMACERTCATEILANLITNAVKYNRAPAKRVWVGARGHGDEAVIYVRDNGIGIPESRRDAVFTMFRRLHARDAFGGGTGAGLALCRRMVHRHGGRIWIEPGTDAGSTFCFTLAPAPQAPACPQLPNQAPESLRVMRRSRPEPLLARDGVQSTCRRSPSPCSDSPPHAA